MRDKSCFKNSVGEWLQGNGLNNSTTETSWKLKVLYMDVTKKAGIKKEDSSYQWTSKGSPDRS